MLSLCSLADSLMLGTILVAIIPDVHYSLNTVFAFTYEHVHCNAIMGGSACSNRGCILIEYIRKLKRQITLYATF